jgi:menaquinone-dependent protoporphyrinogen oxidase
MSILVTFGSKRGGTEGLAAMVADGLRQEGFTVDVIAAPAAKEVDGYEAVIVGGALYAFRWHRDARRFTKRHTRQLRLRPTWFFSSGPVDESATQKDIPPVKGVQALMDRVQANGHVTFGGRLAPDAKGFPASAMAKKKAGDWRDPEQVRTWTHQVATHLRGGASGAATAELSVSPELLARPVQHQAAEHGR